MNIKSFGHVGITVSNFSKAVKWYNDNFNFKLIDEQHMDKNMVNKLNNLYGLKDTSIHFGFLRAPKGGVIEVFEFSTKSLKSKVVWNRPGITHMALNVKNIDYWYEKLSQKGVKFFSKPQKSGKVQWVFLEDPDGNLIELIDLKENYFIIKWIGGLVGTMMKKNKFKKYY